MSRYQKKHYPLTPIMVINHQKKSATCRKLKIKYIIDLNVPSFVDLFRCTGNDMKMIIRLIKHDLRISAGAKQMYVLSGHSCVSD